MDYRIDYRFGLDNVVEDLPYNSLEDFRLIQLLFHDVFVFAVSPDDERFRIY